WEIYFGSPPFGGDMKVDFRIDGNSSSFHMTTSSGIGDGAWHMVVCWFDVGSGIAGIQVDNGTPVTQSGVDMFDPGGPQAFFIGGNLFYDNPLIVDELAFWDNYVLTADDK